MVICLVMCGGIILVLVSMVWISVVFFVGV